MRIFGKSFVKVRCQIKKPNLWCWRLLKRRRIRKKLIMLGLKPAVSFYKKIFLLRKIIGQITSNPIGRIFKQPSTTKRNCPGGAGRNRVHGKSLL